MVLPGPLRAVGKKHIQTAVAFIPSAAIFGASAAGLGLYFTEWKTVLRFMPYYNGKYKNDPVEE